MANLYEVIEQMKPLFTEQGFTVYDNEELDHKKITRLDSSEYPVILISEESEQIDNEGSPTDFLNQTANISIDCILEVNPDDEFRRKTALELRLIKLSFRRG